MAGAIALAYAGEGAKLALAARSVDQLEETAGQARSKGAETCIIEADVAQRGIGGTDGAARGGALRPD